MCVPPPKTPELPPSLLQPVIPDRPTKTAREATRPVGVRFALSRFAQLQEIAETAGWSISEVVNFLVEGGLRLREWQRRLPERLDDEDGERS